MAALAARTGTGGCPYGCYEIFDEVLIVKWIAQALKGHTLDVLGLQSAPIEEVFGFEAVNTSPL
ncbi:Uncharacterized protein dnl_35930 [Desulfonema limicola]|uniref:Uncharacterized protein n=1 Tax=Desulfonema limicola TaxID=45656 RepID=A0A975B9E4_9BACT|nr:hypothetical protein [Desulfonema limicola]QTA81262.1 Uncharacterized protein dnl_35930 [Desulfonema limicola]